MEERFAHQIVTHIEMPIFFIWYNLLIILGMLVSIPCFFLNIEEKKIHRIVFSILVLASGMETFALYLSMQGIANAVYYNIFYIYLQTFITLYFFNTLFYKDKVSKLLLFSAVFFFIWGIVNSLFFQSIYLFQTYSYSLAGVFIIGCSINYFYNIFFKNWYRDLNLLSVPCFWIVSVILFFYSGTFLFFSTQIMWIQLDYNLYRSLAMINKVLAVNMYLVMGIAFYVPFVFKDKKNPLMQRLK